MRAEPHPRRRAWIGPLRIALLSAMAASAALSTSVGATPTGLIGIYRLALKEDPEYLSAGAVNRAAQESRPQALAALKPTVAASASLTGTQTDIRRSSLGQSRPTSSSKNFSLTLSQPVYRKDLWIQLEQADMALRKSDVQYAAARQDLMVRVSQRYFGVLRALDELSFAKTTLEAFKQQLEQSRQRFEVGLIAITDVEEAKAGFDRAKADVIGATTRVDNAREAMRELTGTYHTDLATLQGEVPLLTPDPPSIDSWTQTALKQNLSILSARLDSRVAEKEIRRISAQHLPTLDLVGSHAYASNGQSLSSPSTTVANSIGLQLAIPIYQGGLILSQTRESRHLHRQTLDEYERQRRSAQRTTRDAFLGVQAGISRVNALAQAVLSAKSAKNAVEAGFEVGTRTSVDVLNADRDYFRARRDLSFARYAYILNIIALKRAAGVLSEDDLALVDAWLS